MSAAAKSAFRELRQAVLNGFGHAKDKLHQVTDKMNDHLDTVIKRVKDKDNYDGPNGNGGPAQGPQRPNPDGGDGRLVPRPETLDENGNIDWSPAPHNGFTLDADGNPIRSDVVPIAGDRFDRYGTPDGRYVSPIPEGGPYPYDNRSLPYHENPNAYRQYEWTHSPADVDSVYNKLDPATRANVDSVLDKYGLSLSDLASVSRGEVAPIPGWGTSGGATQDLLPVSVELLDIMGMIKEVG